MIRKPVVSGMFYPDNKTELKTQIQELIEGVGLLKIRSIKSDANIPLATGKQYARIV